MSAKNASSGATAKPCLPLAVSVPASFIDDTADTLGNVLDVLREEMTVRVGSISANVRILGGGAHDEFEVSTISGARDGRGLQYRLRMELRHHRRGGLGGSFRPHPDRASCQPLWHRWIAARPSRAQGQDRPRWQRRCVATAPFLPADALERLAATGWLDRGVSSGFASCIFHDFERPETCQHLVVATHIGKTDGPRWAILSASKTWRGTRRRYDAKPPVYESYSEGRFAAFATRTEMAFLADYGVELRCLDVYNLTSGRGLLVGRRNVRKLSIHVAPGRRVA
jgi:hypothetical protein